MNLRQRIWWRRLKEYFFVLVFGCAVAQSTRLFGGELAVQVLVCFIAGALATVVLRSMQP